MLGLSLCLCLILEFLVVEMHLRKNQGILVTVHHEFDLGQIDFCIKFTIAFQRIFYRLK